MTTVATPEAIDAVERHRADIVLVLYAVDVIYERCRARADLVSVDQLVAIVAPHDHPIWVRLNDIAAESEFALMAFEGGLSAGVISRKAAVKLCETYEPIRALKWLVEHPVAGFVDLMIWGDGMLRAGFWRRRLSSSPSEPELTRGRFSRRMLRSIPRGTA